MLLQSCHCRRVQRVDLSTVYIREFVGTMIHPVCKVEWLILLYDKVYCSFLHKGCRVLEKMVHVTLLLDMIHSIHARKTVSQLTRNYHCVSRGRWGICGSVMLKTSIARWKDTN